jgi:hypothetical protein
VGFSNDQGSLCKMDTAGVRFRLCVGQFGQVSAQYFSFFPFSSSTRLRKTIENYIKMVKI